MATIWQPHPDNKPQCAAYDCTARQVLYGGAAGGGKSDLLLGLARTKHAKALLLRRTFPDLERSLITRSLEIYGDAKSYNGSKHVWKLGARRIEFGHMEQIGTPQIPKDEGNYASADYDLIGVDQAEQFPEYAFDFLNSRARTTKAGQPVQVILSANPVGEGVEWLMRRWAPWLDETYPHPAKASEVRYFKRADDGREIETSATDPDAVSRTFIPAGLKDNPYLGDDYRRQLALLPEPLRSALLNGDWKASITDDAYQVIPRAWIKAAMARWRPDGRTAALDCVGVDVARGGEDQTVLARRFGYWFAPLEKYAGSTTPDGQSVTQLISQAVANGGRANVDVIGVGAAAYDISRMMNLPVCSVNFAEHTDAKDKSGSLAFVNVRAEAWWGLREALDPNTSRIALPDDPELLGDLIAPRWTMQSNGIKIESKDDIKKRLGRSPDCGDSVVLANYGNVSVDEWIALYKRQAEGAPTPAGFQPSLPAGVARAPQYTPPLPRW